MNTPGKTAGKSPGRAAIGTWSGGRYLHFGEAISEDRLQALLRPSPSGTSGGIDTLLSADAYGQGEADELLGRALEGFARERYSLVGAVGHDFYEGERDGPRGFPRFTDPRLRGPDEYAGYLRTATEKSLERIGESEFDVLLLHNPDRTGYESEVVWDAMAGLRDDGLAGAIGVAPGPANGFTLDLIRCLERFGDRIDWAMVILNPFEPWPGELVLDAADRAGVRVITRVVDYGGPVLGRRPSRHGAAEERPPLVPARRMDRGGPGEARQAPADLRAHWPHHDAARLPVEPRPPGRRMRRADADPGGGARRQADRGQARRARGASGGEPARPTRTSPRSRGSGTTPGRWR